MIYTMEKKYNEQEKWSWKGIILMAGKEEWLWKGIILRAGKENGHGKE